MSHVTEVIADETDVAILLMYHWNRNLHDIFMTTLRSKKSWIIGYCSNKLSAELRCILPFLHAFSGCDTASAIFGHGKPKFLKLCKGKSKEKITYVGIP